MKYYGMYEFQMPNDDYARLFSEKMADTGGPGKKIKKFDNLAYMESQHKPPSFKILI